MVTPKERLPSFLGTVMLTGSFIGVLLSFTAVTVLIVLGGGRAPWPLWSHGWWSGGFPKIEFLAGFGILLLAATPVAMLVAFGVQAARERYVKAALTACGLLLILACGLALTFLDGSAS